MVRTVGTVRDLRLHVLIGMLSVAVLNGAISVIKITESDYPASYLTPNLIGTVFVAFVLIRRIMSAGDCSFSEHYDRHLTASALLSAVVCLVATAILVSPLSRTEIQFATGLLTSLYGLSLFISPVCLSGDCGHGKVKRGLTPSCLLGVAIMICGEALMIYAHT